MEALQKIATTIAIKRQELREIVKEALAKVIAGMLKEDLNNKIHKAMYKGKSTIVLCTLNDLVAQADNLPDDYELDGDQLENLFENDFASDTGLRFEIDENDKINVDWSRTEY